MFGHTFGLKIHNFLNLRNKITEKFAILLISIFLHEKILHHIILLQILRIISYVIGYVCLHSKAQGKGSTNYVCFSKLGGDFVSL